jgi:hypothetical protein
MGTVMPKEVIRSNPNTQFYPEVRWGRDMDVQVATIDGDKEESDLTRGVFATVDRQAINRLINVLRRARDAAYGRDE